MQLTTVRRQLWSNGLLIGVLLLALALRLYRIEAQSLWNDEGTSVALAARSLNTITRSAANDIHPPLYYYLLHLWIKLFGSSELSVRSLSALLGTLVVLLTYAFSRATTATLFATDTGTRIAMLAALFSALSPFEIYYSQETRMYMLSAFLGALSMHTFLRLLAHWQEQGEGADRHRSLLRACLPAAAYTTATVLLLYTHYLTASIIVVQNLAFLCWCLTDPHRHTDGGRLAVALRWGAVQAVVAAAYLPWIWVVAEQLRAWPAISESMQVATLLRDLLRVLSLGVAIGQQPGAVLIAFAALLLVGITSPLWRSWQKGSASQKQVWSHVTSLLYLLVPVGMVYLLSLQRPLYNPKFLLPIALPFHLFLAQAVLSISGEGSHGRQTRLRGTLALAAVAFVAASSWNAVQAYYSDPRYARDDYRGIAQYIQAVEGAGDAILVNAPGQIETFAYYYQGSLPVYPLPRQRPLDEAQTEMDLHQMTEGQRRVFAVLWATDESDPKRFVEGWLDQHTYKAMDSWYGNVRLVVYAVPIQWPTEDIQHPLHVTLGDRVQLLGYNLLTTEVQPGGILQLTLFWQAIAPINERYKVFTHVVDGHGHLVGQRDAEPGGGALITTIWEQGEQVVDNYGLPILPAAPPGEYAIAIGMYGLGDSQRLPVIDDGQVVGDHVVLQPVRVLPAPAPPPLAILGMTKQLRTSYGDINLLGYKLAKLGFEHQPDSPIRAGDILHLTLFWQASRTPREDVTLVLQLQDERGATPQERRAWPTEGLYPLGSWCPGEIVRDQHNWPLSADLRPGRYSIHLSVRSAADDRPIGAPILLTHLALQ
jgi:uncharacterized membrane protein